MHSENNGMNCSKQDPKRSPRCGNFCALSVGANIESVIKFIYLGYTKKNLVERNYAKTNIASWELWNLFLLPSSNVPLAERDVLPSKARVRHSSERLQRCQRHTVRPQWRWLAHRIRWLLQVCGEPFLHILILLIWLLIVDDSICIDASVWPSSLVHWLVVNFVPQVVGSNPSKDRDSHFVHPLARVLKSRQPERIHLWTP